MARRSTDDWRNGAIEVVRAMLSEHGAVTTSEMEARGSDRTYDPHVFSDSIDPHHFVDARQRLQYGENPEIVPTVEKTRSGRSFVTWSSVDNYDSKAVQRIAGRKRLLSDRHAGWSQRGGAGHGLIGAAGEGAMVQALREADRYTRIQPSTTSVLGVDVTDLGEVDVACGLYDDTDESDPVAITVMVEVKNTRSWHYDSTVYEHDGELRRFLNKAARVQAARPAALICPVVIVRRGQYTLVEAGRAQGFLVGTVYNQLVLQDHDIARNLDHFDQVRDELGYADLTLFKSSDMTTNYHRGIANKHIPNNARATALTWRETHADFIRP